MKSQGVGCFFVGFCWIRMRGLAVEVRGISEMRCGMLRWESVECLVGVCGSVEGMVENAC